jgi:DNA-binding NarL/FixJ family response regulator
VGLTVLIVDDHAGFRGFARRLLEAGGMEVVGEAASAASALSAAEKLKPGVILLDVRLPDGNGIDVATRLSEAEAGPAVVLVSSRDAGAYGPRLEQCGARGFIPKAELTVASLVALVEAGA